MMPPGYSPYPEITVRLLHPTSGTRLRCRVSTKARKTGDVGGSGCLSIDADGQETYVMRTGATVAVIRREKNK